MILDLRKGFGEFEDYNLFKFPDNSVKFQPRKLAEVVTEIKVTLRNNDDIISLLMISDVFKRIQNIKPNLLITYMMYQQDDRLFVKSESFGLKVICDLLNTLNFGKISIFHPHSDKVELLNNCEIIDNFEFVKDSISKLNTNSYWVIPDSGAFKTQFKQIEKLKYNKFITCMKSRSHDTGEIETIVNCEDLQGKDCFIVDDICLGGRTFINIAQKLKEKNCGKLFLIVSHGIFNYGIDNLLEYFEAIYTTDSICTLEYDRLSIYNVT
jgi:ribose-phosphate pyrophosphokinase